MKRLVTQFDDTRTRATLATPTCCCCCCCCVVSLVSTTAATAMNAHDLAADAQKTEAMRWLYGLGAFLVLALAFGLTVPVRALFGSSDELASWAGVAAFYVIWAALLTAVYRQLGLHRKVRVIAVTVVGGTVLFAAEFVVAAYLLLGTEIGWIVYVVLIVALPFPVVRLLRMLMGTLTRSPAA